MNTKKLFSFLRLLAIFLLFSACAQLKLDDRATQISNDDGFSDVDAILVDSDSSAIDNDDDTFFDDNETVDISIDESADDDVDTILVDEPVEEDVDEDVVLLMPSVIPTLQKKCYNNSIEITCPTRSQDFYGQDAHYLEATRVFTVHGGVEKTVVDSMTNLEWQQAVSSTLVKGTSAWSYCNEGIYAGYDDWRLPTIEELSTLVHYGKSNPTIDEIAFPKTPSNHFWSFTPVAYRLDSRWRVNFIYGDVRNIIMIYLCSVRCVRGEYDSDKSFEIATLFGDVVVTDSKTNLVWQQRPVSNKNWKEALDYCELLDYAGNTNWRLPDVNELKTIINYVQYDPAIDGSAFPETPSDYFWSSTTEISNTHTAWSAHFYSGHLYGTTKTDTHTVRCVR